MSKARPVSGPLFLQTLGDVALYARGPAGERVRALGSGKPLALLTYVALTPGRSASREHLIDLLWSDLEPERSKHALRQTIYFLRSQLGDDALGGRQGELALTCDLVTDRDAFLSAVESGDLETAASSYTGTFLPGFAAPGGAEFEHWADLERERLRTTFARAAESLARRHLGTSSFREAQRLARRVRDEDPLNESSWRLLMETLVAGGEQLTAAIEADALTTLLEREGRTPEPATRAVFRLARQRSEGPEPEATAAGLATELVGREAEFSAIIRAWETARAGRARHVHVSAPAGLGKTRLLNDVNGRLRAGGVRVAYLRASPGDRRIAYGFAGDLARLLGGMPGAPAISPAAASALVSLHPGLSSTFSTTADTSTADEALRRRTMALSELVAALADETPLALLIDDVHWADPASVQVLLGILERVGDSRVLVVTTARTAREDLVAAAAGDRLVLRPLTVEQVGTLIAGLGALPDADWRDAFIAALHATTAGSPLLVLETLQLALDRGSIELDQGQWSCGDPVFLITELQAGGALRHRIAQLDAESRDLLVLLATAGAPTPVARVVRATGLPLEDVEARLAALERRGFVTRGRNDWEPTHDQIAEIAMEMAPMADLRAQHAALGRVLAGDAEFDPRLYPRAAQHLALAHRDDELTRLYRQYVDLARGHGDRRPAETLAAELLGEQADVARTQRLVRSLPLIHRARLLSWHAAATAAVLVLLATSITVSALGGPDGAPTDDNALLVFAAGGGDSAVVLRHPIDLRDGESGPVVVSLGEPPAHVFPSWTRIVGRPEPSADAQRWAYALATGDSGVVDIVVSLADGRDVRLTSARGDDAEPAWAPDAYHLAFTTRRWSAGTGGDGDIAAIDLATRQVRRLTGGPADDYSPRWSPDGTRIAFARRYADRWQQELCWVTTDGRRERCSPAPDEVRELLGWTGPNHLLALIESGDDQAIVRVATDGGDAVALLRGPVMHASLSPDGGAFACLCQRTGDPAPYWYLHATSAPDAGRRVELADGSVPAIVEWTAGAAAPFLAEFAIRAPERPVTSEATYRLRWTARDADGAVITLPPAVLEWRSADTTIATVDPNRGVVAPRRTGRIAIHASAGGWRGDSIVLEIAASTTDSLLAQRWTDRAIDGWRLYGTPRPRPVRGPEGVPALLLDGDGSFLSGVYSRTAFAAAQGLGVEARVSTPVRRARAQQLVLGLTAALDGAELERWDHTTGDPPGSRIAARRSCSYAFPGGAGAYAVERATVAAAATSARIDMPVRETVAEWYAVRLQIFPDGTCGVAVNGTPVWRSEASLATADEYRVQAAGSAVGAPMLVGPLEVWSGVRGGVDWTLLEPPR